MSRRATAALLLLGLAGLVVASTSVYVHVQLLRNPAYVSFCHVTATVNCDDVYRSSFAMVRGIPVAAFGWVYYLIVAALAAAALRSRGPYREHAAAYIFGLSTLAVSVSFYLAYISFGVLKRTCLLCAGSWLVTVALFVIAGVVSPIPVPALPRRFAGDVGRLVRAPVKLVITLLIAAVSVAALAAFPVIERRDQVILRDQFVAWYESLPRKRIRLDSPQAAVLIVKFNDFQCPSCAEAYVAYEPILQKYRGRVQVVLQDYPLNPACNQYVRAMVHPNACDAALAEQAAAAQGKGAAYQRYLYANQGALDPANLRRYAEAAGLDLVRFDQAMAARDFSRIARDVELGHRLGVNGTPTFFINGRAIQGMALPFLFEEAIKYELAHADAGH